MGAGSFFWERLERTNATCRLLPEGEKVAAADEGARVIISGELALSSDPCGQYLFPG